MELTPAAQQLFQGLHRVSASPPGNGYELVLNVENDCNLACDYCFADQGRYGGATGRQMKPETARARLLQVVSSSPHLRVIKFFGGEPLLNLLTISAVCEEVSRLVDAGSITGRPMLGTVTNLTFLPARALEAILRFRLVLTVSIDGPAEVHDRHRVYRSGRGTWSVVARNWNEAKDAGVVLGIESVFGPDHMSAGLDLVGLHQYLQETFQPSAITISPVISTDKELRDPAYQAQLSCWAYDYGKWQAEHLDDSSCRESVLRMLRRIIQGSPQDPPCAVGKRTVTVAPNGDTFPCYFYQEHEEFRLASKDDVEPFGDRKNRRRVLPVVSPPKTTMAPCLDCWLLPACHMCLGEAVMNGSASSPVPTPLGCSFRRSLHAGMLDGLISQDRAGVLDERLFGECLPS